MPPRAGDVFRGEALVEIDRGIYAPPDIRPTAAKAATPLRIGRFALAGHRPLFRAPREDETMKWTVIAALMFLLVAPDLGAADESDSDMPDRTKLGEFVPSAPPFPAPEVSLAD